MSSLFSLGLNLTDTDTNLSREDAIMEGIKMSNELPESFKVVIPDGCLEAIVMTLKYLSYEQIGECKNNHDKGFIYVEKFGDKENSFYFGDNLYDFLNHLSPEITITTLMNAKHKEHKEHDEIDKGLKDLSEFLYCAIFKIKKIQEHLGEKV